MILFYLLTKVERSGFFYVLRHNCGGFQIIDSHSLSVRPEPRHATDNARENASACQRVIIMSIYLPRSDSEQRLDARLGAPSLSISISKVVKVVNKVRRSAGETGLS